MKKFEVHRNRLKYKYTIEICNESNTLFIEDFRTRELIMDINLNKLDVETVNTLLEQMDMRAKVFEVRVTESEILEWLVQEAKPCFNSTEDNYAFSKNQDGIWSASIHSDEVLGTTYFYWDTAKDYIWMLNNRREMSAEDVFNRLVGLGAKEEDLIYTKEGEGGIL